MLLFENREYLARVRRTKEAMIKRGIDLLLVASPANQFWLTGYDGWSFYTPQMVAVSLQHEEPIWVGRKMDAVGAKFTAFLEAENVVPYPDNYVASTELHPMQFLAEEISGAAGTRARSASRPTTIITRPNGMRSSSGSAEREFVDAFLLVNWCRMKKSRASSSTCVRPDRSPPRRNRRHSKRPRPACANAT